MTLGLSGCDVARHALGLGLRTGGRGGLLSVGTDDATLLAGTTNMEHAHMSKAMIAGAAIAAVLIGLAQHVAHNAAALMHASSDARELAHIDYTDCLAQSGERELCTADYRLALARIRDGAL